jgi:hypothetical protein
MKNGGPECSTGEVRLSESVKDSLTQQRDYSDCDEGAFRIIALLHHRVLHRL